MAHDARGHRPKRLTLREETRSAVSRRVNWLIWSTISAILGLVGTAAASVEFHLLVVAEMRIEALAVEADRNWRAQLRAAYLQDMAIIILWDVANRVAVMSTGMMSRSRVWMASSSL